MLPGGCCGITTGWHGEACAPPSISPFEIGKKVTEPNSVAIFAYETYLLLSLKGLQSSMVMQPVGHTETCDHEESYRNVLYYPVMDRLSAEIRL